MKNLLRFAAMCVYTLVLSGGGAHAQLFRAYVASTGSDANPCTVDAPCRLLNAAINAVAAGGEIWMLDSANFNQGTLNIGKSVSILAVPGQVGSIVAVSGAPAIAINGSGIKVALRNVVITRNVSNPGTHGIVIYTASTVWVEDCTLANLSGSGMLFNGTNAAVHVRNSVFRNIGGEGIWAVNGANVDVTGSRFYQTQGIVATNSLTTATTTVSVADSTIAGGTFGVVAHATAVSATANAFVTRTMVHDVHYGLAAQDVAGGGIARVTVSDSTVAGVDTEIYLIGSGEVKSLGNNYIGDNLHAGTLATTPQR